ncbi:Pkinase-domain-containing protein [Rhizopogon vinicolor AM-OR11-026]|uniref:non-specific serine/threonine protein kinase n=1 Tax=Rhizopogon vinicolor AM-OR11-026 TaxID=1314800 RepID=A0A1B7MHP2_9AGAM|nr:Pkinase-domain-containing protein [Rhizopogon vinicolor AM-OR11-026]
MASDKSTPRRTIEDDEARPYVIVTDIGKGSFATVYKGYHEDTHHQVAIKVVRRDILTAKLLDNLQSEIEILKSLSHRHITKLIDIVRAERNIYLIMEYCAGGDLTNYIKKRGRVEGLEYAPSPGAALQYYPHPRTGGLDEIVVRSFLRQLARALKFLRQRNLIHRDIKPQNLLLNPASPEELAKGHPLGVPILKVADFGFARSLPNAMMAETLCGSPLYMAPEILRYEKYDAKADLWSVGAVLYEMCVGKPPFRAQNHVELLKKIEHSKGVKFPDEDPARVSSNPSTPPTIKTEEPTLVAADIKDLIRALLRRRPAERASFEEFFKSKALAKSKFPRPAPEVSSHSMAQAEEEEIDEGQILEHHRIIPPEVLDPKAMIPPSKFHFRRRDTAVDDVSAVPPASPTVSPGRAQTTTNHTRIPTTSNPPVPEKGRAGAKRLVVEGSIIPGESEEDGLIRKEYVLVDPRAVEFTRAVDELNGARRPPGDRRAPSSLHVGETSPPDYMPSSRSSSPLSAPIPTFPPPPHPLAPPLSSSPTRAATNALSRALSLASRKLFGATSKSPVSPSAVHYSTSSSPRRPQLILRTPSEREKEIDPMEDELLANLEELAQKTDFLTHWADEMYEYVKAVPQKPLPDPAKFSRREGEPERHAQRRRNADQEAEYNAVTCVAVYMLLMSFSQKGIDKLRNFQEHLRMRHPDGEFEVSEGFDDALSWFKEHFIKCSERAALVKTWLPAQYDGPKIYLDQLVYDRALLLSRTAARKELLDQASAPNECEKLYEESLWCLYTLQDDLQSENPFMEEDRATIATWITRTKLRLVRCRARMRMSDKERLRDALADQNLVDARYPPPWDLKAVQQVQQQQLQQEAAASRS